MVSIDDLNDAYKRINPYIVKTPIHISKALNKKFDSNIFLKDETKQLTGSFKIRGALSALSNLKQININVVVAFKVLLIICKFCVTISGLKFFCRA